MVIYCDPPYAGTKVYEGAEPFDHAKFYRRIGEWITIAEADVFVSEYDIPFGRPLLEFQNTIHIATNNTRGTSACEKLYHFVLR